MRILLIALYTLISLPILAQNTNAFMLKKVPKIKTTTLLVKDDILVTKTSNWYNVTDKTIQLDLFAVENDKFWTGQTVAATRILGWWGVSDAQLAYIYAVDLVDSEGVQTTAVFVSSFHGIKGKLNDENPFGKNPSPTGMRGKITVTHSLVVNEFGVLTLTSTNKSSTGKVLKKVTSFYINDDGKMIESGK